MPRIRTIKPDFATNEKVVACTPRARLLFILMWCFSDDQGIHPASLNQLKMEVFPGDNLSLDDMRNLVDELVTQNLIQEYEMDGKSYFIVTEWANMQRIDRPIKRFPLPEPRESIEPSTSPRRALTPGKEGNGKEKEGNGPEVVATAPKRTLRPSYLSHWEAFCKAYPKRNGDLCQSKARDRFLNLCSGGVDPDLIVEGAERYRAWCDATEQTGTRFVRQMTSFLNQRSWEADWEVPSNSPASKGEDIEHRKKPIVGLDYELKFDGMQAVRVKPGTSDPFDETAWCHSRGVTPDFGVLRVMKEGA